MSHYISKTKLLVLTVIVCAIGFSQAFAQSNCCWSESAENLHFMDKISVASSSFPGTVGSDDISDYRLFVNGGILAKEVRVRTDWADYVFENNYRLASLPEVERFIHQYGHLSNVPSAATVETNGLELGEIAKIQQEKIEELTLYIIEQDKRIHKLESSIDKLQTEK